MYPVNTRVMGSMLWQNLLWKVILKGLQDPLAVGPIALWRAAVWDSHLESACRHRHPCRCGTEQHQGTDITTGNIL